MLLRLSASSYPGLLPLANLQCNKSGRGQQIYLMSNAHNHTTVIQPPHPLRSRSELRGPSYSILMYGRLILDDANVSLPSFRFRTMISLSLSLSLRIRISPDRADGLISMPLTSASMATATTVCPLGRSRAGLQCQGYPSISICGARK